MFYMELFHPYWDNPPPKVGMPRSTDLPKLKKEKFNDLKLRTPEEPKPHEFIEPDDFTKGHENWIP